MIARLLCLLGRHKTYVTVGAIKCRRCPAVLDSWRVLRPEVETRAQRAHAEAMAERETRAANLKRRALKVVGG